MLKTYLKQAWELLKQNKLFSSLYTIWIMYDNLSILYAS